MTGEERINYWKGIIEKYRESGLSVAEFCKEHNINSRQLYYWRKRFGADRDQDRRGGFYELVSCDSSGSKTSIHI